MRKRKYYLLWLAGLFPLLLALFGGGRAYAQGEPTFNLTICGQSISSSGTVPSPWIEEGSVDVKITPQTGFHAVEIKLNAARIVKPASVNNYLKAIECKGAVVATILVDGECNFYYDRDKEGTVGIVYEGEAPLTIKAPDGATTSKLMIRAETIISAETGVTLEKTQLVGIGGRRGIACTGDGGELTLKETKLSLSLKDNKASCITGFISIEPKLKYENYVTEHYLLEYADNALSLTKPFRRLCSQIELQQLDNYRGIQVGGVPVTADNESDVLGDNTVTYNRVSTTF